MSGSTNWGAISGKCWNGSALRLCVLPVILFILGCQKSSAPVSPENVPSFRSPTATEVFNLRSKCAELGEKIMKNTVTGDELTKNQVSHYDPKTNRCYVQLTVWNAKLGKGDEYFQEYLYDGQTGQLLAEIRREKGTRYGDIYNNPSPMNGTSDELYLDASNFISKMMEDDRQQ